jgi:transposase
MLIPDKTKIFFYTQPVDMRKSIDTLCQLIADVLQKSPIDGSFYLFRGKSGNKLKALYYETNAFTLSYRRLEKGRYATGCITMTEEHFRWLLASDKYALMEAGKPTKIEQFY